MHIIIKDFRLSIHLIQAPCYLLKVSILSCCGNDNIISDFLIPADIGVFLIYSINYLEGLRKRGEYH
jgi:hypothetical protein